MTARVRGKTVLLTGATGGIGHAIAREFSAQGAVLILTGRRVDVLQQLASELGATFIAADLTQPQEVARLIDKAGQIDVFVANAGVVALGKLGDFARADIEDALAVNLRTPILMAHQLVPLMQQRASGHIVFIGSIGCRVPAADAAIYDATKFGLRGFALGLRQDLHNTGVGVSIVEPGFIREAGMFVDSGASLPRGFRTSAPRDVARAVIRAVQRNTAETVVAPIEARLGVTLCSMAPGLGARAQRLFGLNFSPVAGGRRRTENLIAAPKDSPNVGTEMIAAPALTTEEQ
jgi:short-subunit dehydrogenase